MVKTGEIIKDAIEVGGGFLAANLVGRKLEQKFVSTPVTSTSSITDKIKAGLVNNAPKLVAYYVLDKVGMRLVSSAMIGSVTVDLLIRATNQGVNPLNASILGFRVMGDDKGKKTGTDIDNWIGMEAIRNKRMKLSSPESNREVLKMFNMK